jgi:hypothetical protein
MSDEIKAAIALLREAGFLVAKIPECKKGDRDHGRHTLLVRSAMCDGGGTIPHGYHSSFMGSFGMWVNCLCGHSFSDYDNSDDRPSKWAEHKQEHKIEGNK